ncbi:MAG: GLUG motif-containing protein [Planctomycetota bacterium]|jgi:hypothetical protein
MYQARISSLLGKITILFVICCCSLSAQAKYGGGSGTPEDPYQIRDANHMQAIGADSNDWDNCFRLMADIDLGQFTGDEFNIIAPDTNDTMHGFQGTAFTGVFDGGNHTISNFIYDSNNTWYIGLFGYVYGGKIKNLGLIDPNIDAGTGFAVGSLVCGLEKGIVCNCYTEGGSVSGNTGIGGLVGANYSGTISNCNSESTVSGRGIIGGLVGVNDGISSNCYATGKVAGDNLVGGLVGRAAPSGVIVNCYATGDVDGGSDIGGIVGSNEGNLITNSYASGDVKGENWIGGLCGYNSGEVSYSYATGSVTGEDYIGGLVGENVDYDFGNAAITNCYSTGKVDGAGDYTGGLVGKNGNSDSFNCYVGVITNSYWNAETSGEPNMCGSQSACSSGCDPNCGKTTTQMKQQSTFENWDFINVWNIGKNQTYPYLRIVPAGDINKDGIVNFLDIAITANQWMEEE